MSNYTKDEQTEIVGNAVHLTAAIEAEEEELERLRSETFRPMPSAPVRKVIGAPKTFAPQYPKPPKTKYTFTEHFNSVKDEFLKKNKKLIKTIAIIAAAVLAVVFVLCLIIKKVPIFISLVSGLIGMAATGSMIAAVVILLKVFSDYSSKCSEMNKELAQTPEYLKAVEEAEKAAAELQKRADEEHKAEQARLDEEYRQAKDNYDNIVVPQYKREAEMWSELQQKKIAVVEEDLRINRETLKKLYETTKLISASYRDLGLLEWMYEDMSTSDHDIRYATELLDRDRQRAATLEAGSMVRNSVREMNRDLRTGLGAIYSELERGNEINADMLDTLAQNNKQLSKVRRDMNIGTAIGTVQRHKTNKILGG